MLLQKSEGANPLRCLEECGEADPGIHGHGLCVQSKERRRGPGKGEWEVGKRAGVVVERMVRVSHRAQVTR